VLYADDLVKHFGVDAIRYYLLREMPFAQDGTITLETIIARYNADLANTLGNLVNRTVAMVNKYFGGSIVNPNAVGEFDEELKAFALDTVNEVNAKMDELKVADSIEAVMNLARRSNKYIDETMPWALAKDEAQQDRLKTVLCNLIEAIRYIGVLIAPFMPETGAAILSEIKAVNTDYNSLDTFGVANVEVGEAVPLFARLDEAKKLKEVEDDLFTAPEPEVEEEEEEKKPEITIDDFAKMELKVGLVLESKPVEGAKKLLVSQIKIGKEVRQIVSGIAQYYKPEELVGKKVVVVTNLKPVKLRGVLSEGMVLCASKGDKLCIVTPDGDMEDGSEVC